MSPLPQSENRPTSRFETVQAPKRPAFSAHSIYIFLAGTTAATGDRDWRDHLIEALSGRLGHSPFPVVFLNPKREDWDSTWKEDLSDPRWADQVDWELTMQQKSDIVVVLFHSATMAPVSMLEFGLAAKSGTAIACALPGFSKSGNIKAVSKHCGVPFVSSEAALVEQLARRVLQSSREPVDLAWDPRHAPNKA